jgi:hypothetical protein
VQFFLGTHMTGHLTRTDVPLFISARRLRLRTRLPHALGPWALDSGGFSELSLFGEWRTRAAQYATETRRWRDEIGQLQWAAAQDWMCEPFILDKTGLTVADHQGLTVANYLTLKEMSPDLPFAPVLQGFAPDDYLRCRDLYGRHGVDLAAVPVVGLGSVCRRQGTSEADAIIRRLHADGLTNLHGFGFKTLGLRRIHTHLASADSLAWSYRARKHPPLPGHRHKTCANCLDYALRWRDDVLDTLTAPRQTTLW